MSSIKIGSRVVDNVETLDFCGDYNLDLIEVIVNGDIHIPVDMGKYTAIWFEIKGNVNLYHSANCAVVVGNIDNIRVQNTLIVEGTVKRINIGYKIEKSRKVYADSKARWVQAFGNLSHYPKYKKILVIGDINRVNTSVSNIGITNIVRGNIKQLSVENSAEVKGRVGSADVGNCAYLTQGRSTGLSTKDFMKKYKDWEKRF